MMTPTRSGRPVGNGSGSGGGGGALLRRHPSQFSSNSLPIQSPRSAYPALEPHIQSVTVQYFGPVGYSDRAIPFHLQDESGRFQTIEEGVELEEQEEEMRSDFDPRASRMIEYNYTHTHAQTSIDRYRSDTHNREMPPPSPRLQRLPYPPHAQDDSQVVPESYGAHTQAHYDTSPSYHQDRETAHHTIQPVPHSDSTHRSAKPSMGPSHRTPAHTAQPQQYKQEQNHLTPQHPQYPYPQVLSTQTIPDHPYSSQAGSGYQQDFHPRNPQDLTRDDHTDSLRTQGQDPRVSQAEPINRQPPPPRFAENRNKPQAFPRHNPQTSIKQHDEQSSPVPVAPPQRVARTKEEAMKEFQAQKKVLGSQKTRSQQDQEEVDRKAMPPPTMTMTMTATLGSQLQTNGDRRSYQDAQQLQAQQGQPSAEMRQNQNTQAGRDITSFHFNSNKHEPATHATPIAPTALNALTAPFKPSKLRQDHVPSPAPSHVSVSASASAGVGHASRAGPSPRWVTQADHDALPQAQQQTAVHQNNGDVWPIQNHQTVETSHGRDIPTQYQDQPDQQVLNPPSRHPDTAIPPQEIKPAHSVSARVKQTPSLRPSTIEEARLSPTPKPRKSQVNHEPLVSSPPDRKDSPEQQGLSNSSDVSHVSAILETPALDDFELPEIDAKGSPGMLNVGRQSSGVTKVNRNGGSEKDQEQDRVPKKEISAKDTEGEAIGAESRPPPFRVLREFRDVESFLKTIRSTSLWKETLENTKSSQDVQWALVGDLATKQTEATKVANKNLNNLILAYSDLLEIKDQAIEQKMKMTTRFKRAGEELSAQCVDLQASTTQLHLNKRRKGRPTSRGVSTEENGKGSQ